MRQLVTLASLVEKETAKARGASAGGGGLRQPAADRHGAAVRSDGHLRAAARRKYTGNLRRDDLQFDSPYNTYRYPGPAARPDRRARARRRSKRPRIPPTVDYLYFVSRNDGSHEFARTLDEHNRNVQRWQVQYFRDQTGLEGQELGIRNSR